MIGGTNCVGSWLVTVPYVHGETLESLGTAIRATINTKSGDLDLHDIIKIKNENKVKPRGGKLNIVLIINYSNINIKSRKLTYLSLEIHSPPWIHLTTIDCVGIGV